MNLEIIFSIVNFAVLPAWLLMMILPGKKITQWVVYSYLIPMGLASIYGAMLIAGLLTGAPVDMMSLKGLTNAFQNPQTMLVGWIHYLVFDLFVGMSILKDSREVKIPHVAMIPCLILTFMAGPIGFLFYRLIRLFKTRSLLDRNA